MQIMKPFAQAIHNYLGIRIESIHHVNITPPPTDLGDNTNFTSFFLKKIAIHMVSLLLPRNKWIELVERAKEIKRICELLEV